MSDDFLGIDWEQRREIMKRVDENIRAQYSDSDRHERWKTIASFSAEATANFLGGGDIGKPDIKDPATAARLDRQHANLRRAIHERVVPSLAVALERDSAQTAHRLRQLSQASYGGDAVASGLLAILLGELLNWGLKE